MSVQSEDAAGRSLLLRAHLAIEDLQSRLDAMQKARTEPIAIVGMGCRFPGGAVHPEGFWRLLRDGVDAVSEVPPSRWNIDEYYDPDPEAHGRMYTRHMATVDDIDRFDAQFFGISPREATTMDPQQRLLLEVAWESLEHAGIAAEKLVGSSTGVFVGIGHNDHSHLLLRPDDPTGVEMHMGSGSACSIATGRIAYCLGLQGPTLSVDTACSSSLVVLHLACLSLRARDCDLALAGGVNIILSPLTSIIASKMRMLSPDGRCKTFDASANGFVRGEGCGMVVLKRLSDAVADRDRILGVVRGSAINQDGRSTGLTVPNGPAQEALIRRALDAAGVRASDVSYVEAHGTGTSLGDPIEVQALGAVFADGRSPGHPLLLGSVKTNIGHLEVAAGVAGLIKVLLAFEHGEIPRHLHLRKPNPQIAWSELPIVVPSEPVSWPAGSASRIAGISSFGFSGTNVHVILEDPPPEISPSPMADRPAHLLALSARTEQALRDLAGRYANDLEQRDDAALGDVCFTAGAGRSHFTHRLAVVTDSASELRGQLAAFAAGRAASGLHSGQSALAQRPKVAFLFTGQGSQYPGMARELYDTQPTFRRTIEHCDELLRTCMDRPLLDLLYGETDATRLLVETRYQQPALFALEYALAMLWKSWGIETGILIGHSVGEYVAACLANVFSLEDGLKLIAARARLMQSAPGEGAMAAVIIDEANAMSALTGHEERVSIAAVNTPRQTVLSGPRKALERVLARLAARGIETHPLRVSHAFHSSLMEPILDEFEQIAAQVTYRSPAIPLVSNVSGRLASGSEACSAHYWREHIRHPVRFLQGMRCLAAQGVELFLECGAGTTLLSLGRACLDQDRPRVWINSIRQGESDWRQMLSSLGALYVGGTRVDFAGLDACFPRRRLALPTYPFQSEPYWVDASEKRRKAALERPAKVLKKVHPLLGSRVRSALTEIQFESVFSASSLEFLSDHRVHGMVVLAGAAYLEMALAAARAGLGEGKYLLEDFSINEPLILQDDAPATVQSILRPGEAGASRFEVLSLAADAQEGNGSWILHAAGTIRRDPDMRKEARTIEPETLRRRCPEPVQIDAYYERLHDEGLLFGPSFRALQELWGGDGQCVARIRLPDSLTHQGDEYHIHPVLLDAMFQSLGGARTEGTPQGIYVPIGVDRLELLAPSSAEMWSYGSLRDKDSAQREIITVDLQLFDVSGRVIASVEGLRLKRATREAMRRFSQKTVEDCLYEIRWEPRPLGELDGPAAVLPHPSRLAEILGPRLAELTSENQLSVYSELISKMDALSVSYVVEALIELGWAPRRGRRFTSRELADQLGIVPSFHRLLDSMCGMLRGSGMLRRTAECWEIQEEPASPPAETVCARLMSDHPACRAELGLLGRCGARLADVLSGHTDPLELLFPKGSLEHLEEVYRASPFARASNQMMGDLIAQVVAASTAGRSLRILEVGAGTGGTTAYLLDRLPADRTDYVFSDLSPMFLAHGRRKFAAYPFVRYELLDIERLPEPQRFEGREFDVVLAVNVLHATQDLHRTLENVHRLLAPGGLLVLGETTARMAWADLIFGLTEGWWKFTDTELRPDHPLLARSQWLDLLAETGFSEPTALGGPGQRGEQLEQSVILARRPAADSVERGEPSDSSAPGSWLILSDRQGVGSALASQLQTSGARVMLVLASDAYARSNGAPWQIDAARPDHLVRLFEEIHGSEDVKLAGVINLLSLDCPPADDLEAAVLESTQVLSCGSTLSLVQALAGSDAPDPPRLWLVTRGAQPAESFPDASFSASLAAPQASLWGLGRVIAREYPHLHCTRIDLDPSADPQAAARDLFRELRTADGEDEIAFRGGKRLVARMVRSEAKEQQTHSQLEIPHGHPFHLVMDKLGVLDDMRFERMERTPPGPGEVEIRVLATGLNFLDVLTALDMCPTEPNPLGLECAGRIAAVGAGVTHLDVGDEVVAIARHCFGTHVTTNAHFVARKPPALGLEEAITIPTTFWTAWYGLFHIGRMSAGDKVLIHAAAGGVGQAAIQLAQWVGAEIFATAGNPEKREFLRSLGVQHVFDSRTLHFADQIMEITGGRGVDIVLNSLGGEFIARSMSVLAPNGRFVEIGKSDIWDEQRVAAVSKTIRYEVIYMDRIAVERPEFIGALLAEILQQVEKGTIRPLPHRVFPIARVIDAFRYMAQARHIGKIVVTQDESGAAAPPTGGTLRSDATYLVTGGLGGIGLVTAEWLVQRGARHLMLIGRKPPSDAACAVLDRMRAAGADVRVQRADVCREDDVARVLDEIRDHMPPLCGIIHSAGVLDDGVLARQTWNRFATVLRPKVVGAWNLHRKTRDMPLDCFVLFSSAAALLGSVGQGNHAAANAFLDGLAHDRRSRGLSAISINWGPWSETGAATRVSEDAVRKWRTQGFHTLSIEQGLRALGEVLDRNPVQVAVMPIDWAQFVRHFPAGVEATMFSGLVAQARSQSKIQRPAEADSTLARRLESASESEREELLRACVVGQAVKVLGLSPSHAPNPDQHLSELGLDSLMAVELKNSLEHGVGRPLPTTLVFDCPTINDLVGYLIREISVRQTSECDDLAGRASEDELLAELAQLPEEKIDAMLNDLGAFEAP